MKGKILLLLLSLVSTVHAQSEKRLGDLLFDQNKSKEKYSFNSSTDVVEIGSLIHPKMRHAIIFQQIDSINHMNQLKFISYNNEEVNESILDTIGVGILVEFEFIDKTFDGHQDLLISIGGNRLFDYLYVFNPKKNTLVKIEGFQNHPSTQEITDQQSLFSYMALGCADNIWESKLIKIIDFKVVELGRIYGRNCNDNQEPVIEIYSPDKTTKHLPYSDTLEKYPNGKFDFIKDYWYKVFSN